MKTEDLETPALLVDWDVVERNLETMSGYCQSRGIKLRPHVKTHKSPFLASRQIQSGACGISVAKPGEAEVMVESGLTDILLAYPVIVFLTRAGVEERGCPVSARGKIR